MKDDLIRAAARLQAAANLPLVNGDDSMPSKVRKVCTSVNEFCQQVEPIPLSDAQQRHLDQKKLLDAKKPREAKP
jgi:hypothetical protein